MSKKVENNKESHSYNINGDCYKAAKLRAIKAEGYLANLLENTVVAYSQGLNIQAVIAKGDKSQTIDIFDMEPARIMDAIKKFKKECRIKK